MRHEAASNLTDGDWCAVLIDHMFDGASTVDEVLENKVGFVSFNYDRCFEELLLRRAVDDFSLSREDAARRLFQKFRGAHPYGSLGQLLRMGPNTQEYGTDWHLLDRVLLAAKQGIALLPDDPALSLVNGFPRAQLEIKGAHVVHFLGFGFHTKSMCRLGFGDPEVAYSADKVIRGTALGREAQDQVNELKAAGLLDATAEVLDVKALEYVKGADFCPAPRSRVDR